MTATADVVAPEVAEAQKALDAVPAEWRNDALDANVLQRAAAQALHRALGERVAMAEVRQAVAAAAVLEAGADPCGLDDLIEAQIEGDAAAKVQSRVTVPDIDPATLRPGIVLADKALADSDRTISLPAVAYDAEMIAWRQFTAVRRGVPVDPPTATDLCRAASRRAAALVKECDAALRWTQDWRRWVADQHGGSLGLLASAAAVLGQRKALAQRVAEAAVIIGQANRQRRDAKLNWPPPGVNV